MLNLRYLILVLHINLYHDHVSQDWSCILKIIQDVNIFQDVLNGGILSTLNSRLNQVG